MRSMSSVNLKFAIITLFEEIANPNKIPYKDYFKRFNNKNLTKCDYLFMKLFFMFSTN